jgi:hypothetical protein
VPDGASAQAEPPVENTLLQTPVEVPTLPGAEQRGYIEVSTGVPPPTKGPFSPPPPLTDPTPPTQPPGGTSQTGSD